VSASSVVVAGSPGPAEVLLVLLALLVLLVVGAALVGVFVVGGSSSVVDEELPPRSIGPAGASPRWLHATARGNERSQTQGDRWSCMRPR